MRNILITGCSTGMGLSAAKALIERGYTVFATVRNTADVEKLKAEGIKKVLILDYADPESVDDCANELIMWCNRELYAVFHNGAYGQAGAIEDLSREAIEQQFAANVFGWIQLTNRLLPLMHNAGVGRIIFNSSLLGYVNLPFRGAYNASKHAIEAFAGTLRLELSNTNIGVSLIQPGPVETAFRANALQAMQRHVDPERSRFRQQYQRNTERLAAATSSAPFTLPAESVVKPLLHALESSHPKAAYKLTKPAYILAAMRRLLPREWQDKLLLKISASELSDED